MADRYPYFARVDEDGGEHDPEYPTFEEAKAAADREATEDFGMAVIRVDGPNDTTHLYATPDDGCWPPVGLRVIDGQTFIDTSVEGADA